MLNNLQKHVCVGTPIQCAERQTENERYGGRGNGEANHDTKAHALKTNRTQRDRQTDRPDQTRLTRQTHTHTHVAYTQIQTHTHTQRHTEIKRRAHVNARTLPDTCSTGHDPLKFRNSACRWVSARSFLQQLCAEGPECRRYSPDARLRFPARLPNSLRIRADVLANLSQPRDIHSSTTPRSGFQGPKSPEPNFALRAPTVSGPSYTLNTYD